MNMAIRNILYNNYKYSIREGNKLLGIILHANTSAKGIIDSAAKDIRMNPNPCTL
jgi:hypothetical protein